MVDGKLTFDSEAADAFVANLGKVPDTLDALVESQRGTIEKVNEIASRGAVTGFDESINGVIEELCNATKPIVPKLTQLVDTLKNTMQATREMEEAMAAEANAILR